MINVDAIIFQLRKYAPALKQVSGAAQLDLIPTITNLPMPAAFVVPLGLSASPNEDENALYQRVTATFSVVVVLDNTVDKTGLTTMNISYGDMTGIINKAILNWSPVDNAIKGCQLVSSALLQMDRAKAFYEWTYSFEQIIDETDGYQETGEDISIVEDWQFGGQSVFRKDQPVD